MNVSMLALRHFLHKLQDQRGSFKKKSPTKFKNKAVIEPVQMILQSYLKTASNHPRGILKPFYPIKCTFSQVKVASCKQKETEDYCTWIQAAENVN